MIRVFGLTKDYGSRRAIGDLTFNAEKGEILGFLGPNGAGKTTTMRILTGYMPPTSGEASIGGYDVIEDSLAVRRMVGYLPESVPLYADMTLYEYLKYMADLRKIKNARQRIYDTLEMVQLTDRAHGYIGKLSKGMRQRIGKDRTVLLSTHILPEVQQVCDRVLIINKGKIVAEDTPSQLQARLTGAQHVQVRVRGEIADLLPQIDVLPGVMNVTQHGEDRFEFETQPGQDARPLVARTVVNAGYDLLEFQPVNLSLEDIFLQLTRDEVQTPSGEDELSETEAETEEIS